MADRVRMKSLSVFANPRVTVFNANNPEGAKGEPATFGDEIETDLDHAKDLARLGLAEAINPADLEGETRLEPGYQVSVAQLRAQEEAGAAAGIAGADTLVGGLDLAGDTGANPVADTTTSEAPASDAADDAAPADAPAADDAVQASTSRKAQARKAS